MYDKKVRLVPHVMTKESNKRIRRSTLTAPHLTAVTRTASLGHGTTRTYLLIFAVENPGANGPCPAPCSVM